MRVLVTHEESGVVRDAFLAKGHDAWSNDILDARDGSPFHLRMDAIAAVTDYGPWDIIISHIECTEMAVSGNRWYGVGTSGSNKRIRAVKQAEDYWALMKKHARVGCAIENPVSVLWNRIGKPQYIQPWQFGHKETKKTGILADRLPPLEPTDIVGPPPAAGTKERKAWEVVWRMAKSATRKRDRSETKKGIADAMAEQWGRESPRERQKNSDYAYLWKHWISKSEPQRREAHRHILSFFNQYVAGITGDITKEYSDQEITEFFAQDNH